MRYHLRLAAFIVHNIGLLFFIFSAFILLFPYNADTLWTIGCYLLIEVICFLHRFHVTVYFKDSSELDRNQRASECCASFCNSIVYFMFLFLMKSLVPARDRTHLWLNTITRAWVFWDACFAFFNIVLVVYVGNNPRKNWH